MGLSGIFSFYLQAIHIVKRAPVVRTWANSTHFHSNQANCYPVARFSKNLMTILWC